MVEYILRLGVDDNSGKVRPGQTSEAAAMAALLRESGPTLPPRNVRGAGGNLSSVAPSGGGAFSSPTCRCTGDEHRDVASYSQEHTRQVSKDQWRCRCIKQAWASQHKTADESGACRN